MHSIYCIITNESYYKRLLMVECSHMLTCYYVCLFVHCHVSTRCAVPLNQAMTSRGRLLHCLELFCLQWVRTSKSNKVDREFNIKQHKYSQLVLKPHLLQLCHPTDPSNRDGALVRLFIRAVSTQVCLFIRFVFVTSLLTLAADSLNFPRRLFMLMKSL